MVKKASDIWLIMVFLLSILAVILSTGYKFAIQKNYPFLVEQACDPNKEQCYHRDCRTGDCPPNDISDFKVFEVRAADFPKCSDDSCTNECSTGAIQCKQVFCDASSTGDICDYINGEVQ